MKYKKTIYRSQKVKRLFYKTDMSFIYTKENLRYIKPRIKTDVITIIIHDT